MQTIQTISFRNNIISVRYVKQSCASRHYIAIHEYKYWCESLIALHRYSLFVIRIGLLLFIIKEKYIFIVWDYSTILLRLMRDFARAMLAMSVYLYLAFLASKTCIISKSLNPIMSSRLTVIVIKLEIHRHRQMCFKYIEIQLDFKIKL